MFPPGSLLNLSDLTRQVTLGADHEVGVNAKLARPQGIVSSDVLTRAVTLASWPAAEVIKPVAKVQIRPDAGRRPARRPGCPSRR